MPDPAWFAQLVRETAATLTDPQVESLYRHFELLLRWNERMDLTSLVAPDAIVRRHYAESLFFSARVPDERPDLTILDFGSGAGFPGVPFAVLHPDWRVTLLEANQRRAVFLKEATRGIPNVRVVAERGEKVGARYDWIIARAVNVAEVLSNVPRLGEKIGLLIGDAGLPELQKAEQCVWGEQMCLPGSDRRFCVFGEFHVEQSGRPA